MNVLCDVLLNADINNGQGSLQYCCRCGDTTQFYDEFEIQFCKDVESCCLQMNTLIFLVCDLCYPFFKRNHYLIKQHRLNLSTD